MGADQSTLPHPFAQAIAQAIVQALARANALAPALDSPDSEPQIHALVSEASAIQQDIEDSAAHCTSLEQALTGLEYERQTLLKQDAAPAMDALLVLVDRIESLHQVTQDQRTPALITYGDPPSAFGAMLARAPLVNACKLQSQVVFGHFQSLSEKAKKLTQQFTELATDLTFQTALAQERIEKLQNMVKVAETLRNGVESQRESWQGRRATAEAHIRQARETIRSAERKLDSRESARVVRNFLTFGIGEVFDFFDLNEEIEDAERTVASAEQNAHACEQSIQRAVAALQRINDEVARLDALGGTARAQETTLQESVTRGQELRTRALDLTNASLDVSLFVGTLSAKSETLGIYHTAQEFARGVLSFGRLMMSEGGLNGLLVERDPEALQKTLDLIACTDGEDSGRSLETQEPRLAIEDMM